MIYFVSEVKGFDLKQKMQRKQWLKAIAANENQSIGELTYVFVTDEDLLKMNVQFLEHDTFTDIITFDISEPEDNKIMGDVFISIDRVRENASRYKVSENDELTRVMSHGLLHLCGYKDKSPAEAALMRQKENEALALWHKE